MADRTKEEPQETHLEKISLYNRKFSLFIKQIEEDEYYLVKYGSHWHAGLFSPPDDDELRDDGFAWHFDLGSYSTQLISRMDGKLDKEFEEVYHIVDPALTAKRAKKLLDGKRGHLRQS
jgi:hypothetical protein